MTICARCRGEIRYLPVTKTWVSGLGGEMECPHVPHPEDVARAYREVQAMEKEIKKEMGAQ